MGKNELDNTLFSLNPLPSWIYDLETLEILDVNLAAIANYGYSREEFLNLTLKNLGPPQEVPTLINSQADIKNKDGNIYFGIFTHQKKDGKLIQIEINGHRVDFNDRSCMLMVCQHVTEKIEQEERIHQSEQRFKALVQEGSDLIAILDEEGKYVYVSPTSISVLGIAPEEFIGRSPFEFIHPDDAEKVSSSLQKIATEKKVLIHPFRFQNKDKEWRWIETVLTNMMDNPSVRGIVGNSRDITDKLNAQKQLEANELFNRTILESSPDCLKVLDPEGRLQFMNLNGLRQMEIDDFSDIKNKNWWVLWGSDNEDLIKTSIKNAMKGETTQFSAFCPTAKGTPKWWNVMVSPVGKTGEPVQQIVSVSRDITALKKEEQRLKLLESVIINTNDAIVITEAEPKNEPGPRILYVNEAFTKMTGYSAEEAIGKSPRMLQGPNSDYDELARMSKALQDWEPCEITTINYKKNGEEFWNNFSVSPVADEKGWFTHWISIERDVTEQKQKELQKELLGVISQNFSYENDLLAATSSICQTICDYGRFDFVEVWLPIIENTHIQLFANKSSSSHADTFYKWSKDIKSFAEGEGLPGIVWNKKTTLLWEEISKYDDFVRKEAAEKAGIESAMGIPLTFNEKIVGVLVVGTQRELQHLKKYQVLFEQLQQFIGSEISRKKLENDLQHLYDAIPDLICTTDLQGRFLQINQAGCELIGHSEEEILYNTFEKFVHPDDKDNSRDDLEKLKKGGKTFGFENRYLNKSGDAIWLSWTSNSNLQEGLIYATARNITNEKRLRELNRQVSKLAKIGSWEVNFATDEIIWSEMLYELHETDPKTFTPNLESSIDFYRDDFKELVRQSVDKCASAGIPFDFEAVIITAKNNERWIRAIGNAEMVDWKCQRIYGSFQDINLPKTLELQVREILESISDAFYGLDRNWNIIYFNKEAENLLKRKSEEVLGKNLWEEFAPAKGTLIEEKYRSVAKTGKPETFEYWYPGDESWYEINAYPSKGGVSAFFKNIDERKSHQEQLLALNESLKTYSMELERSNEELESFAFITSHDLQEPLRMISSFMDQLKRKYSDQLDERALQYIHFAIDGAKRMRQIILDLLDYSRAGQPAESITKVDLNQILADFKQLRRKTISEKSVTITIANTKLPTLITSKAAITQVFHSLLDNAIKYSKKGIAPYIELSAVESKEEWVFSIKDNGIGIESEFFNKIFIIFQRLHNRNEFDGTGIGLSIAKKHVEFLGGKIWLESTLGDGSTFYFTLPKT